MSDTWYIHITKASRKYDKTRQTFYNYINKWYIKTKKINNKLFLSIRDIEYILNDIVNPPQSELIEQTDAEKKPYQPVDSQTIPTTNTEVNQIYHISSLLEKFSTSIQRQLSQIERVFTQKHTSEIQRMSTSVTEVINQHSTTYKAQIDDIQSVMSTQQLTNKKILFWLYLWIFLGVNIIILRLVS